MSIKEQQWQREENLFIYLFYFFFFFPGIRVATQIQSFHWGMKTRFQGQGQALPSIYAADLLLRRHPSAQVARLSPWSSLLMPRPLRQTQAQAPWPSCAIFTICTERGKAATAGFREVWVKERWTQGSSACTGGTERECDCKPSGAWKSGGDGCAFFSRQKHSLSLTTAFLSKFVSVYHEQR